MNATRNNKRRNPRARGASQPLQRALLASMIAAALSMSSLALAQEDEKSDELIAQTTPQSTVEFGLGWIDDSSFRFGKYTGLENDGLYGVFNIDYIQRHSYDSERTDYVRIQGTNLGLRSRSLSAEYGKQGNFRVGVSYDQIPSFKNDSAQTIFDGAGSSRLTLPPSWVPATTTAGMSNLLNSLKPIEIKTERERWGVRVDKILPGHFEVSANYRYEEKDGLKSNAGVIGNTGGNPRAALLPEPVQYNEHQFDAIARYTEKTWQFELRYHMSLFADENSDLVWQNPFSAINGWIPSAGFPTGQGQLALPPDNEFHQGTAVFGWDISNNTRLTADLAIGRMSQDDRFLPLTINPVAAASIFEPLPRDSLNGEINTTVANLRISSRPTARLNWVFNFRYDDRDNNTPRDEYNVLAGDSILQQTNPLSGRTRLNQPYSYEEIKFRLDGGYRFDGGTRLAAAAEHKEVRRTFAERRRTDDNSISLRLSHTLADSVDASVHALYADRGGTHYDGEVPTEFGFPEGFADTLVGGFENAPQLRRFHLASRERTQVGGQVSWAAADWIELSANASYSRDNYDKSELGLTESKVQSYTFDASGTPSDGLTWYGFYTYDKLSNDQTGVSFQSGAARVDQVVDPARFWFTQHADRVDTLGAGFAWKPDAGSFQFGMDLLYSNARAGTDTTTGSALTSAPLPNATTKVHSGSVYGQYRLSESLSLRATVWHERWRSFDYAFDGLPANQLANVILFGDQSPDFDNTAVTVTMQYRF